MSANNQLDLKVHYSLVRRLIVHGSAPDSSALQQREGIHDDRRPCRSLNVFTRQRTRSSAPEPS